MKKIITALMLLVSCLFVTTTQAQIPPYGLYIMQGSADGSFYWGRYFTPPNPTSSYLLMYDGVTSQPKVAALGGGLTWDGTTLGLSTSTRSVTYTTRPLNTCFQVSATRDAHVNYSVDILTNLSLSGGQAGTVYLRTYTNSACTNTPQEASRFANGQTGTLTVGLALSQNVTGTLTGTILAGTWAQLVTENNTGVPTFTTRPGQETLL